MRRRDTSENNFSLRPRRSSTHIVRIVRNEFEAGRGRAQLLWLWKETHGNSPASSHRYWQALCRVRLHRRCCRRCVRSVFIPLLPDRFSQLLLWPECMPRGACVVGRREANIVHVVGDDCELDPVGVHAGPLTPEILPSSQLRFSHSAHQAGVGRECTVLAGRDGEWGSARGIHKRRRALVLALLPGRLLATSTRP